MGFSLFRLRQSGRDWSRGDPPPRGSIEYVGVGDMFEAPPLTASGTVWEISATELEAAKRWCDTLARSVDYARQVHGDRVLSPADAEEFTRFYTRWKKFADRVGTWSLVERAKEANKVAFESLLSESKVLRDRFVRRGMAVVPVPYVTELVLMLRHMPPALTPRDMVRKLETAARWGEAMVESTKTTGEWVQRSGMYAALASYGPAGLLFAHHVPTSWDKDRTGLRDAIADARKAAEHLKRASDASSSYGRGDPVYDEFLKRVTRIYIEAAGLYGIREAQRGAVAEAVDAGARPLEKGTSSLPYLLALAGVSYLGVRWLEARRDPPVVVEVPDTYPDSEAGAEGGAGDDVGDGAGDDETQEED